MNEEQINYEYYDKGYWNAVSFAYIPDFHNQIESNSYNKGYLAGMVANKKAKEGIK